MTTGRIRSLDSLRGVAALVVVLYHFSLVVPGVYPRLQTIWPLRIFIAGQAAVYLFFVLSGFVLYLSLRRHDRDNYLTFAARRLVRLYPPVVVSILLAAAFYLLVGPTATPNLIGWVTRFSWTEPLSPELVAGHLLLLDTDRFHSLDNPIWSLVVEVRLSLLFPLLAAGLRRRPMATTAACVALSMLARQLIQHGHQVTPLDPIVTLQFLDLFAIGALMARYATEIAWLISRAPPPLIAALTLAALCQHGRFELFFTYAGALLLVAVSFIYPRLSGVYALGPFVWLGERSFSLYLIHVPLLLAAVHALDHQVSIGIVLAGAFPLCLLGAELFWRVVERPCINLSRHVGRWLSRRRLMAGN